MNHGNENENNERESVCIFLHLLDFRTSNYVIMPFQSLPYAAFNDSLVGASRASGPGRARKNRCATVATAIGKNIPPDLQANLSGDGIARFHYQRAMSTALLRRKRIRGAKSSSVIRICSSRFVHPTDLSAGCSSIASVLLQLTS